MEKLQEDMTKNVCEIPFDDLGINTMFVDEAHNYNCNTCIETNASLKNCEDIFENVDNYVA